jgi:hypothetical protein
MTTNDSPFSLCLLLLQVLDILLELLVLLSQKSAELLACALFAAQPVLQQLLVLLVQLQVLRQQLRLLLRGTVLLAQPAQRLKRLCHEMNTGSSLKDYAMRAYHLKGLCHEMNSFLGRTVLFMLFNSVRSGNFHLFRIIILLQLSVVLTAGNHLISQLFIYGLTFHYPTPTSLLARIS